MNSQSNQKKSYNSNKDEKIDKNIHNKDNKQIGNLNNVVSSGALPSNNAIINSSQSTTIQFNQTNTQLVSKEDNKKIPKAPVSDYTYQDFIKILKAYLKELKELNITNSKLSREDVLVINDLISESNQYIVILMTGHISEAQDVLDLSEKIVSAFFLVFKNLLLLSNQNNMSINETNSDNMLNTNKLLSFPFVLKLSILEVKFQFYVNYYIQEKSKLGSNAGMNSSLASLIEECDTVVYDLITIQERLNLGTYSVACSKFYLSIVNFFKRSYQDCISLCKEAIELLENKNLNNEKAKIGNLSTNYTPNNQTNLANTVNTGNSNVISTTDILISHEEELKDISKLITITDFLAQVYELLKE